MKKSFYDYCTQQRQLALLQQWDVERNGPLTPQSVSFGSHRKLWWQCEKGHQWQAAVKSRVSGAGCPHCANRVLRPGENDLAAVYPDLAQQWDQENLPLTPVQLLPGSRKKVWWRCEKGHRWQAMVVSRTRGTGCPVCAGKLVLPGENDLASHYPALAQEWAKERNGDLTPETCSPASNRKVWWCCPLGHAYQATVAARTAQGSGCPYCAGRRVLPGFNDLATLEPRVAASWHPSLNAPLTPDRVSVGSRHKAWWLCDQGHVWKTAVYSRTGREKCGCPVCAGRGKRPRRYGSLPGEQSPGNAGIKRSCKEETTT